MYLAKLGPQKTSFNKCLKSSVLEDHSTDNITNGLKYC